MYSSYLLKARNLGKWVSKWLALEELQMSENASQDIPHIGSASRSSGNPIWYSSAITTTLTVTTNHDCGLNYNTTPSAILSLNFRSHCITTP